MVMKAEERLVTRQMMVFPGRNPALPIFEPLASWGIIQHNP